MLTVLAWVVFIPSIVYNFILWAIIFHEIIQHPHIFVRNVKEPKNLIATSVPFIICFVSGVYLFGLW